MKDVVKRAYEEALRQAEQKRRAANIKTVEQMYQGEDARVQSAAAYSRMKNNFLAAIRGGPIGRK